MTDIFKRYLAGEVISADDPESEIVWDAVRDSMNKCRECSQGFYEQMQRIK